jgi:nitronate monooxygenase
MHPLLSQLGVTNPVLAAPMAGGPTTPALVAAAARSGGLGFLAAGYKEPDTLASQIAAVRERTDRFGVNLFAPNPVPVDPREFRGYAEAIQDPADRYGIDLRATQPVEDDDRWHEKVDLLLASAVPIVSFALGVPSRDVVAALKRAGSITVQTVTSPDEAQLAQEAGVDALVIQASVAGGHYGTLTPGLPPRALPLAALVKEIGGRTELPLLAAGGLCAPEEIAAILRVGVAAVLVGTVLLRCDESGASAVHKAAIANLDGPPTIVTRAFTGRPARAIPNTFTTRYDAIAPAGYPAIHHLTSGLRKAAAADGNPELVNLWAGTGYRSAPAEPAERVLDYLATAI